MINASNLSVLQFVPPHFDALELQPSQAYVRAYTGIEKLQELAERGPAYTILAGGRVIFCGGLREYGSQRGVLWSFIAPIAGDRFVAVHRHVCRFIETVERPYMQATCRSGFAAGARWLRMLGFQFEKPLGHYGPGQVPHDLFMRVR